jgi:hypothetical protein
MWASTTVSFGAHWNPAICNVQSWLRALCVTTSLRIMVVGLRLDRFLIGADRFGMGERFMRNLRKAISRASNRP